MRQASWYQSHNIRILGLERGLAWKLARLSINRDCLSSRKLLGVTDMEFLDLNKLKDRIIFDQIIEGNIEIQPCQFQGNEQKCPKFELANDAINSNECSTQALLGSETLFCELLPVLGA